MTYLAAEKGDLLVSGNVRPACQWKCETCLSSEKGDLLVSGKGRSVCQWKRETSVLNEETREPVQPVTEAKGRKKSLNNGISPYQAC